MRPDFNFDKKKVSFEKTSDLFRVSIFRQKATECLYVMAGHAVGRDAFLENEIIIPVSKLFDDPVDIARKNAHKVRLNWTQCMGELRRQQRLEWTEKRLTSSVLTVQAMEMISETPPGAAGIVEANLVPKVNEKIFKETGGGLN